MALSLIRGTSTYGCLRAHADMPWSGLQLSWSRCLDLSTWENQLWQTPTVSWQSQKQNLLGSLDYMHWKWKNCPKALQGNIRVILRSSPSFWKQMHRMIFGFGTLVMSGSHNDINVLQRSSFVCKAKWRKSSSLLLFCQWTWVQYGLLFEWRYLTFMGYLCQHHF